MGEKSVLFIYEIIHLSKCGYIYVHNSFMKLFI